MTLIAGLFSRHADTPIPDSACNELAREISRHSQDRVEMFRDRRACIAKVDVGAFGEPAWLSNAGSVTAVAGCPLIGGTDARQARSKDTAAVHECASKGEWGLLAQTRGVFSAAHYSPGPARLILATDRLGVRPVFVWVGDQLVAFASQLRLLEAMSIVPKEMDVRAVTEMIGLGFPLADRTPYSGIVLLHAGEVLSVTDEAVVRHRYWRWDDVAPSSRSVDELAKEAYRDFEGAVRRRLGGDRTTAAYLSGGLDSRAIVAQLRRNDARVYTFNFGLPGTLDDVLSTEFARLIGTIHERGKREPTDPQWSAMMASCWTATQRRANNPAEHPGLVWSGDGGSVSLGHVYLTEPLVAMLRAGDQNGAIQKFLERQGASVPRRLLKPLVAQAVKSVLHDGIREELERLRGSDPGRRFHIFLMLNDQRRHLANHFETIDLHRLEFQLPFFDGRFLETVMSAPLDACLGHRFYMKWLDHFRAEVKAVPWQAYPGHEPCPLPMPAGTTSQWEQTHVARLRAGRRRQAIERGRRVLSAADFPEAIIERNFLRLTTLLYRLGIRDYRSVMRAAHIYYSYYSASGGRYRLPQA
ncbi:MAG: hypothetical protein H0W30_04445 [Gemmatimonadaceae bacterium]|nr:hypothetical protein [Gemmatimonadaceae bacterium]MDQ3518367.1 asparagine synthetase B family protein [Gemmatimonadota bacterium]